MLTAGGASSNARVLIVTPQPFYEDRGTPIAIRYVAQALSQLGAEVDILAFPVGQAVEIPRVNVIRSSNPLHLKHVPIGFSWRKLVLDSTLWQSFLHRVNTGRYHMVHAVEEAAYMAAAICPQAGQPFIYDMASAIPVELKRKRLFSSALVQRLVSAAERKVIATADKVVCSSGLADYVAQQVPEARVSEWVYPAHATRVDGNRVVALRQQLGIRSDQRVMLYSGNFAPYQGVDLLLEGFRLARKRHPELALVCVGATDKEFAEHVRRGPGASEEPIHVLPRQPRDEIPVYMKLADYLVLPRTTADNVPLKLFDYMAAGKPIIATRGPAHEPLLDDSRAFMSDPSPDSLAAAFIDAVESPQRAAAAGRSAQIYAVANFGWERFVDFIQKTYLEALSQAEELRRIAA